jgi:hypothetical protein
MQQRSQEQDQEQQQKQKQKQGKLQLRQQGAEEEEEEEEDEASEMCFNQEMASFGRQASEAVAHLAQAFVLDGSRDTHLAQVIVVVDG